MLNRALLPVLVLGIILALPSLGGDPSEGESNCCDSLFPDCHMDYLECIHECSFDAWAANPTALETMQCRASCGSPDDCSQLYCDEWSCWP